MQRSGRSSSSHVPPRDSSCRLVNAGFSTTRHNTLSIIAIVFWQLCVLWPAVQLILKEVDSLLYVDTDIIFLQPVEEIWKLLSDFNSTHLAAMAPEHEEPRIGWYNRFARHPYYGKTGVNSGVMLMNMTRLREKYFQVWCGNVFTCTKW